MWKKRYSVILLLVLVISLLALFFVRGRKEMVDFAVNYVAGKRIRMGEPLYRLTDGHYQFKYPPFSALLYSPLSFLSMDSAKTIWFFIVLGSSILIFSFSSKLVRSEKRQTWPLLVWPPLILAKFYLRELQLGQINALITVFLLILIASLAEKGSAQKAWRKWIGGGIWGAAISFKPYALIFFPYLALKKRLRTLGSGIVFILLALALPAFFYGVKGNIKIHQDWIFSLSRSTPTLLASQDNISLIAFFLKWTKRAETSWILYGATLSLLALLFLFIMAKGRRLARPEILESALLLTLIPLISPLGWDYTLLSSALAVTLVIDHFQALPTMWKVLSIFNFSIIGLALYDLMGKTLYARFMALSIPTLNFMILSVCLVWLRVKEYA